MAPVGSPSAHCRINDSAWSLTVPFLGQSFRWGIRTVDTAMTGRSETRHLQVFRDVDPYAVAHFLERYPARDYDPRGVVFSGGQDEGRLYLLLSGVVKSYVISPEGKERITHLFYPGDMFGELILGTKQGGTVWASTISAARIVPITNRGFKRMMRTFPEVCLNIFRYLVSHHEHDIRRLQTLLHTQAVDRLVLTLLDLGKRQGNGEGESFPIEPPLTHDNLGNLIGVVRTTVSELISDLRREGVITTAGKALTVNRPAAERFLRRSG